MIDIQHLSKQYGSVTALDDVNLTIEEGTVFGFVGSNGAGKTTTFSILATLLAPTKGDAYVNGYSVRQNPKAIRRHIGYMPDFFGVYDQFTVREYLHFYGASYHLSARERQTLIPEMLQLVNLSGKEQVYVDKLSRGMKQRLCLARALIHDPEVLILDEPASGLDPRARVDMREILKHLKHLGKTILISSHILPELADMCDEVGIIEKGQLVSQGSVAAIEEKQQAHKVIQVTLQARLDEAETFFRQQSFVQHIERDSEDDTVLHIAYGGHEQDQVQLLQAAVNQGLPIVSFAQKTRDLEDVFMAVTKGAE